MNLLSLAHAATSTCTLNGESVDCAVLGDAVKGFAAVAIIPMILIGLVSIFLFVFWIMMLVHAIKHPIKDKPLWIIIMLLFQGLGAVIYYFVVKRHYVEVAAPVAGSAPVYPTQAGPTPPPAA